MRQERQEHWELGHEAGRTEGLEAGRTEGEWITLISLVQKKRAKGLNAATIADMLERPKVCIEELIRLIEENPGKTEQELVKLYTKGQQGA